MFFAEKTIDGTVPIDKELAMTTGLNQIASGLGGHSASADMHRGANSAGAAGGKNIGGRTLPVTSFTSFDGRDVVSLSAYVPQPFDAKTLLEVAEDAGKFRERAELRRSEIAEIRQNAAKRALMGMKLYADNGGEISRDIWKDEINSPSPEDLNAAYRRLSQRVVGAGEVENPEAARQLRMDLLEFFRDVDWQNFNLFAAETSKVSA